MNLLEARGVTAGYGKHAVVAGLDLEVRPGQRWFLLGANGSGKTTLLRTLLGLLPPLAGSVRREGTAAYLAQAAAIPEHVPLTIPEMVALGGRGAPVPGLEGSFFDLSGGQKGRVLLARALASDPDLLVLDEPAAHFDEEAQSVLYEELAPRTFLLATHDHAAAEIHGTHILRITDGVAEVQRG